MGPHVLRWTQLLTANRSGSSFYQQATEEKTDIIKGQTRVHSQTVGCLDRVAAAQNLAN